MKRTKEITLLPILCIIQILSLAQNPIWSLPLSFTTFSGSGGANQPQPLPTGTTILQYNGSPAQYTHNAMVSAQGDLLFFIIDGYVYDNTGYLIEAISGLPGSFTAFSSSSGANQPLHRFSLNTAL